MACTTSKPVLPGMFQSVKTRSNASGLNSSTAWLPSAASVAVVGPTALSNRKMIFRMVPESSAKSTLMLMMHLCVVKRDRWFGPLSGAQTPGNDRFSHAEVKRGPGSSNGFAPAA